MLVVCSPQSTDLKNAICYNAFCQMEDNMKDINGKPIRKGMVVRRAARGSDIIPVKRRSGKGSLPATKIIEVGKVGTPLEGLICVDTVGGFRVWERPNNFELA